MSYQLGLFPVAFDSAVWLNLLIIFTSMGFVAHSPPNFAAALSSLGVPQGPVMRVAFTHLPLFSKVNGIMNMVFAYGGAMIFPEFMAEMRRPMDFWKGMVSRFNSTLNAIASFFSQGTIKVPFFVFIFRSNQSGLIEANLLSLFFFFF